MAFDSRSLRSTIFLGGGSLNFAIVRRDDFAVPQFYVECPLHTYADSAGKRRRCARAMQTNRPDEATVLRRLRHCILAGLQSDLPAATASMEQKETARRGHVFMAAWFRVPK